MKIRIPLFTIVLFCQVSVSQEVQKDSVKTNELSEVKVTTATRTERVLSSLPLPMTIITSEAIIKSGVTRLNEILNEQTGIILIPDESGFEGIQMQGLDAAYTMILIDGVPLVGRSSGVLDLSRVSVGNIERIEIVKGASSALYGSEAMGGVINVITKKPVKDMFSGSLSYRYATFNTNDANANLLWKNRFSYEPVGNFVYKISEREIEKFAAGLNLPLVAFKKINPNFYFKGADEIECTLKNPKFLKVYLKKKLLDVLVKIRLIPSQVLSAIVFKEVPDETLLMELKSSGYEWVYIPKNPYLT